MVARNPTVVVLASLLAAIGTVLPAQAKPAGNNGTTVTAEAQQSLRAPVTDENFYRFTNGTTANDDGLWRLTVDLPAGTYEYKVAINRAWTENYGAGGARDGSNTSLEHDDGGSVTFVYDHRTHIITAA